MTRLPALVLTWFAFLGIFAWAVPASASHSGWRDYQRHQSRCFRQQRDRELETVRHSTRRAEEELRHWYQSQRNALRADFDRARRHLSGRAWSDYARGHSREMAELARYYSAQRRALTQQRVEAERSIRDYYRQLERQSAGRHHAHWHGPGGHRHVNPYVSRPGHRSHGRPSFSLQLPWIGFSIR